MKYLYLLLSLFTYQLCSAHALWIETSQAGKQGVAQEIRVYYGEYAAGELEEVSKWYSDVASFSLWLVTPSGQKTQLKTTSKDNHHQATFVPFEKGQYIVTVVHQAKDLGGSTKYEFSSNAVVTIESPTLQIDPKAIPNGIVISAKESKTHELNQPVVVLAHLNGIPMANQNVSIMSPEGWSKEYKTNEQGELTFTPIWKGRYVIEVSHTDKTPGEHNGQPYKATWQGATTSLLVSKK
ncbi:MAG: DUF4198 domain-containing protein [Bacteroidota bacterium]